MSLSKGTTTDAKALHRRLAQLHVKRSALRKETRRLGGLLLLTQLRH
jgi:hypothetical protein